jgi:hypothetical protein
MRAVVMLAFVVAMLCSPATALADPRPSATCENVEGTFIGQAVPTAIGFDVNVVEITGPFAGHPVGEQLVTVTIQKTTPGGTIHFTGVHIFDVTAYGPLTTHDKGTIAPNGQVHNILTIVEGAATGTINVLGTADLAIGRVDIRYFGRVCS